MDAGSGSKPETETQVADAAAMRGVLSALGFAVLVAFEKHCFNYRFEHDGRAMLATIVRVPQIDGTFIELKTIVDDERDVASALDAVRSVLRELGISSSDETTDTYTDAVMAARA